MNTTAKRANDLTARCELRVRMNIESENKPTLLFIENIFHMFLHLAELSCDCEYVSFWFLFVHCFSCSFSLARESEKKNKIK